MQFQKKDHYSSFVSFMKFCLKTQVPWWQMLKKIALGAFLCFLKLVDIESANEAFCSLAFNLSQFIIEVNKTRFCGAIFKEPPFI